MLTDVPEAERRQVTVLFADLAGFTKMSREVDSEEMVGILGAYFEVVDEAVLRNGGRLDKHIGDAVMGVFGAPQAFGDEIERALRTSVAIHAGLENVTRRLGRSIVAHVGIATGEVLAGVVGSRHLARYTVLGDAANLASRLDSLAKATETLVSDEVRAAIGEGAVWESRGRVALKGFAEPLPVWRLVELLERKTRELVGRATEVQALQSALDRTGRVDLFGEPGIGKTALLRSFATLVVVIPALKLTEADRVQTQLARALYRSLFGDSDQLVQTFLSEREDRFRLGFFDLLLEETPPDILGLIRDTSTDQRAERRRDALLALLMAWSDGTRIISFDDMHHLDTAGREDLEALLKCASDLPIQWITAGRESTNTGHTMKVEGLGDSAAAELLVGLSAGRISEIIARAAGNPFYLHQLAEAPEGELPGTIQSLVLSRLDALSAPDKRALQVAASLGSRFPAALLSHLVEAPFDGLVAAELLQTKGDDLVFDQALVREGAYASTLRTERKAIHRNAAAWFGTAHPERRAEQLERASDADAAESWLEAAMIRQSEGRFDHALSLVEHALELAGNSTTFELCRASILVDLQRADEALPLIAELLDGPLNTLQRAQMRIAQATVRRMGTPSRQTLLDADDLLRDVRAAGSQKLTAQILVRIGGAHFHVGQHQQMELLMDEALKHARAAGDGVTELAALSGIADSGWLTGHYTKAFVNYEQVIRTARERDLPGVECSNLMVFTALRFFRAEHDQAVEDGLRCIELAEQLSNHRAGILCACELSLQYGLTGDYERGSEWYDRACEINHASPMAWESMVHMYWVPSLFWAGKRQECAAVAKREQAWILTNARSAFGAVILGGLAATAQDAAEREAFTAEVLSLIGEGALAFTCYIAYSMMLEAALERRDRFAALDMADRLDSHFSAEPNVVCTAVAARGRVLANPDATAEELEDIRRKIAGLGLKPLLVAIERQLGIRRLAR